MFELIYGQKGQFCVLYLQIVSFSNLKFSEKLRFIFYCGHFMLLILFLLKMLCGNAVIYLENSVEYRPDIPNWKDIF